jgi:hypothetical protein
MAASGWLFHRPRNVVFRAAYFTLRENAFLAARLPYTGFARHETVCVDTPLRVHGALPVYDAPP